MSKMCVCRYNKRLDNQMSTYGYERENVKVVQDYTFMSVL